MLTPNSQNASDAEQATHVVAYPIDWPGLTGRITRGDEGAFTQFYDRFYERLFRYVLVMTQGDEPLSKDLLQKTMLKVIRYLKPFSDETMLWSWLTQLAKTSYVDHLRRAKRAPQFVSLALVDDLGQPRDEGEKTDLALEAALEKALDLLATDERELIRSVYFEDRSHKQIADSLQSTPKAVESKLSRVRQKLKGLLTKSLPNENQP